jgi:hypothetical protein
MSAIIGCVKPALRREAARRADDGGIEIPITIAAVDGGRSQ